MAIDKRFSLKAIPPCSVVPFVQLWLPCHLLATPREPRFLCRGFDRSRIPESLGPQQMPNLLNPFAYQRHSCAAIRG